MITRRGAQEWENIHVTERVKLADLIFIDNSGPPGVQQPSGFGLLRQIAQELEEVIQDARKQEKTIRALGSGWALSDIAVTNGWLINTKALNGCFDVSEKYFQDSYDKEKRPYLVVAQCGISIGELNVYLEDARHSGLQRALKTAGVGAGQTVVGAISGNTHGSAIKFGSTPDFIVGIQLVSGTGTSYWIERESNPVLNDEFTAKLEAISIRDDDVFNAALVSFGSFGVISAVAIETDPIYHLKFPEVREVDHQRLKDKLRDLSEIDIDNPSEPYHYEFIFNAYDRKKIALEVSATKVDYEPEHETLDPVWIVRFEKGFAIGDRVGSMLLSIPFLPWKWITAIAFKTYRERNLLDEVRNTPGRLFTATISYFEGNTESALGVSIDDAPKVIDIYSDVIRRSKVLGVSQVRIVHPTKALLGFTCHAPKTVVFELGIANNSRYPLFEKTLTDELRAAKVNYTFHWSKNSGIDKERLLEMYGTDRVTRWHSARDRVFNNDNSLKKVFNNPHLERTGLT